MNPHSGLSSASASLPRMADRVDTLMMRGLVYAFDKIFYPMGLHGLGTIGSPVARLRGNPLAEHVFEEGGRFLYPNYDSYWAYYLVTGRQYEPELRAMFNRLLAQNTRFAFIDGGANFGFWSCFLAQRSDLVGPIVAIEPAPDTFAILRLNAVANGSSIICSQAAISDSDRGTVSLLEGGSHASNRVVARGQVGVPGSRVVVPSVTVDGVIARHCTGAPLVIIKIDVEGFEPQAFAGARNALDTGNPVIYECHGGDRSCSATLAAMSYGLAVYFLAPSGKSIRITNVATLCELKTNLGMGYNLAATRPGSRFESLISNA
jgi:FkbM family methyltransferase